MKISLGNIRAREYFETKSKQLSIYDAQIEQKKVFVRKKDSKIV